jgi:hypothetical protein
MSAGSHYEIGRQYALQIKNSVPNFESLIDSVLMATIEEASGNFTFSDLNTRAHAIYGNIPAEYQQEIQGMQSVFFDTDDTVGNGRLSQNKLLVYQLAPDVARVVSCSASAAFGSGTTTGKTILGRNLEWHDPLLPYLSPIQATIVLHNGSKSIVIFGFLGQLFPTSGFSAGKVFTAILDSDLPVAYQLVGRKIVHNGPSIRYGKPDNSSGHCRLPDGKEVPIRFQHLPG